MIFIKWLLFAVIDFLFTAQCYITNPIVCLFADEYGNLPNFLRWWQTWDNTLDVEWMVTENKVPRVFCYDYGKHYVYHYENHDAGVAGYVYIIDPLFTLWERIQRYFCRLAWLYRNTGYGFSYEVTGIDVRGTDVVKHNYEKRTGFYHLFYTSDNGFVLRYQKTWCKLFWLRVFIGWKMQDVDILQSKRCMLAFYLNPFKLR